MKILYVEDNPTNVYLLRRVAKMGKHEIINYIDGDDALKHYDDIDPDLVLMDIQLAGEKTGLDVVRVLRERGVTAPIVAVTAYAMVGDRERCIEAGCDDYLAKPLAIPRLLDLFQTYGKKSDDKPAEAPDSVPVTHDTDTSHLNTKPIPSSEEIANAMQDTAQSSESVVTSDEPVANDITQSEDTDDTIVGTPDETMPINTDDSFDKTRKIDDIVLTDEEEKRATQTSDVPLSDTTTSTNTSTSNTDDVDTQPNKNIDATQMHP